MLKIAVLLVLIGLGAYVRLAQSDPERWHVMPAAVTNRDVQGGAMRVVGTGAEGFAQLHGIIESSPRTRVIAGSVDEGMVSYVTRTFVVGFPDYTTIRRTEQQIEIYGRLRFGVSDFGVNAARIDGWLKTLAEGG